MGPLSTNQQLLPREGASIRRTAVIARVEPAKNRMWLCFPGTYRIPRPYNLARIQRQIEEGFIQKLDHAPAPFSLSLDGAPASIVARRDEAWARIKPVVSDLDRFFDKEERAILMRSAAEEAGIDLATIFRLVAKYFEGGQTLYALTPRYVCKQAGFDQPEQQKRRGRPPREAPPPGEQAYIFDDESRQKVFDLLMNSQRFANFEALYGMVTYRLYTEEVDGKRVPLPLHKTPTRRQIRRLVEKFDKGLAFTKRQLGNDYQLTRRPVDGETRECVFGPGFEYQVDPTGSQVELVSAFDRTKLIGRPTIYLVVDVRTSVIVGFHVTLEAPSWDACRFALFHAFTNKVDFCNRLGFPIKHEDWPVEGLPMRIVGDRGELLGTQGKRLVEDHLRCKLVNTRSYRGDDKAHVERMIGTIKTSLLQSIEGYGPKHKKRNGVNPRSRACLNIYEFTRLVARFCLYWNRKRLAAKSIPDDVAANPNVRATPLGLWDYGTRYETGHLRTMPPDLLYRALLPKRDARMTPYGVEFRGGTYRSRAIEVSRARARRNGDYDVEVHYDEGRPDHIWLWSPEGNTLIELGREDAAGDRERWSFQDQERAVGAKKLKYQQEATSTETERTKLEHERIAQNDASMAARRAAGKPKSMGTQSVHRNRSDEKRADKQRQRHNAGQSRHPTAARGRPKRRRQLSNKALAAFQAAIRT